MQKYDCWTNGTACMGMSAVESGRYYLTEHADAVLARLRKENAALRDIMEMHRQLVTLLCFERTEKGEQRVLELTQQVVAAIAALARLEEGKSEA